MVTPSGLLEKLFYVFFLSPVVDLFLISGNKIKHLEYQHKHQQLIYMLRHLGTTVYHHCAAPSADLVPKKYWYKCCLVP